MSMSKDDQRYAVSIASELSYRDSRLGKLGPASPVRRIDPKTGEVIGEIPASTTACRPRRRRYLNRFLGKPD